MPKKLIENAKEKLEEDKAALEKELSAFAGKDPNIKGNWDTKYPKFDIEKEDMMSEEEELEEYNNLLPIEYSLETRLRDVNLALGKIKEGTYGKCEKCGKDIEAERLKAYPEARTCTIHKV